MKNLTSTITKGDWETDQPFGVNNKSCLITAKGLTICLASDEELTNEEELLPNAKAIAQLPKLLGLADALSQRLEEKYKDTPEEEIPTDQLFELLACRAIKKELLD